MAEDLGSGGFLPDDQPSPAPSPVSDRMAAGLPHPRAHALRPGSAKEDRVRRYAEERLLHISRRFVSKFGIAEPGGDAVGYKSMGEVCRDVEGVIDILWL